MWPIWESELVYFLNQNNFWPLGPNVSHFWSKSEHSNLKPKSWFLILYHSHKFFGNLVGYKLIFSFYFTITLQNTFSSLYLFDAAGCWAPIVRCRSPPSRNCQLDPTTKLISSRCKAGEAHRAPPPTLSLINNLKPAGVLK